jgi:hypothetical protein
MDSGRADIEAEGFVRREELVLDDHLPSAVAEEGAVGAHIVVDHSQAEVHHNLPEEDTMDILNSRLEDMVLCSAHLLRRPRGATREASRCEGGTVLGSRM